MQLSDYKALVEKHSDQILAVERYIWQHPETGFKEWNTTKYLAKIFEDAGYELHYAGDIPGFYTDIDTGRPGPKILILGEMDALVAPTHPENTDGNAHACGHNAQCAALVGTALALKEPGALDDLCGSIRLMAVPAEELIEIEFRDELRKQGIIHYLGGKVEYLYRGYMDGCSIAFMNHVRSGVDHPRFDFNNSNGCLAKTVEFKGKASHAGGSPDQGINALYAANMALNAINSIRETFRDDEHVRVHPIITNGGGSVNIIPAKAVISSYVRGASMESMKENNKKVNRAVTGAALSLGAEATIHDRPGYAPLLNDKKLQEICTQICSELVGPENVVDLPWGCGSTDMGDLSCVMHALHPHVSGASGHGHGDDYFITDPYTACVTGAASQVMLAAALLKDDAALAGEVMKEPLRYASKEAYFEDINYFMADKDAITYTENGATISF